MSKGTNVNAHSPLFPVLIIVRSLRWSSAGASLADALLRVVQPFLQSPEWQIRIAAAQALSCLMAPEQALQRVMVDLELDRDANRIHGELLFRKHLIAEVIDWACVEDERKSRVEAVISKWISCIPPLRQPLIVKAGIEVLAIYAERTAPAQKDYTDRMLGLARAIISESNPAPGQSLVAASAGNLLRRYGTTRDLSSMLMSQEEDLLIPALEHLEASNESVKLPFCSQVYEIVRTSPNTFARIAAIDVLLSTPAHVNVPVNLTGLMQCLNRLLETTKSVPLREAALGGLGWCIAVSIDSSPDRIS